MGKKTRGVRNAWVPTASRREAMVAVWQQSLCWAAPYTSCI